MDDSLLRTFFDEMKVCVRFVMGPLEGDPTQSAKLEKGAVWQLGAGLRSPVRIDIEGQPIGQGELVNVDGRLGVRVSQLEE